jgi:predicted MFS family arabinose efflux permease
MVNVASGIGSVGSGLILAAMGFRVMSWLSIVIAVTPMLLVLLSSRWGRKTALEGAVSG